jgi:hypothetical protein
VSARRASVRAIDAANDGDVVIVAPVVSPGYSRAKIQSKSITLMSRPTRTTTSCPTDVPADETREVGGAYWNRRAEVMSARQRFLACRLKV